MPDETLELSPALNERLRNAYPMDFDLYDLLSDSAIPLRGVRQQG